VTGFRVLSISYACAGGIIIVVKIGGLNIGSGSGSLVNFAIQFAGTTSANEAGKEEENGNKGDDTNDREDSSNRASVVEETKSIISKSPEEFRQKA
jgi:hypothetical protein